MRYLVALLLVACSSNNAPIATDSGGAVDAPKNGSASSDGGMTVDGLTCQTHTRTVVAADGSKTVTDTQFALVDGDPRTAVLELCDYTVTSTSQSGTTTMNYYLPYDPPCLPGSTCTTSGVALPTAAHGCVWQLVSTVLDGKLYVSCGSTSRSYNAGGAMTSSQVISYSAIRLHR